MVTPGASIPQLIWDQAVDGSGPAAPIPGVKMGSADPNHPVLTKNVGRVGLALSRWPQEEGFLVELRVWALCFWNDILERKMPASCPLAIAGCWIKSSSNLLVLNVCGWVRKANPTLDKKHRKMIVAREKVAVKCDNYHYENDDFTLVITIVCLRSAY